VFYSRDDIVTYYRKGSMSFRRKHIVQENILNKRQYISELDGKGNKNTHENYFHNVKSNVIATSDIYTL
jgi:hypothetical protein